MLSAGQSGSPLGIDDNTITAADATGTDSCGLIVAGVTVTVYNNTVTAVAASDESIAVKVVGGSFEAENITAIAAIADGSYGLWLETVDYVYNVRYLHNIIDGGGLSGGMSVGVYMGDAMAGAVNVAGVFIGNIINPGVGDTGAAATRWRSRAEVLTAWSAAWPGWGGP